MGLMKNTKKHSTTATAINGAALGNDAFPSDILRHAINESPEHLVGEDFNAVFEKFRNGCKRSEKFIVESNYKLVAQSVRRSYRFNPDKTITFEDRFQMGLMGLMKAMNKFDIELGNRFSTYALYWIQQNVQRGLCEQTGLYGVYLPVHVHGTLARLRRIYRINMKKGIDMNEWSDEEVVSEYQKYTEENDINEGLNLSLKRLQDIRPYMFGSTVSADQQVKMNDEDSEICLWDFLDSKKCYDKFDGKERFEHATEVEKLLQVLSERDAYVIRQRFFEGRTLDDIGIEIGVTRERIRQIESKSLEKMGVRARSHDAMDKVSVRQYFKEKGNINKPVQEIDKAEYEPDFTVGMSNGDRLRHEAKLHLATMKEDIKAGRPIIHGSRIVSEERVDLTIKVLEMYINRNSKKCTCETLGIKPFLYAQIVAEHKKYGIDGHGDGLSPRDRRIGKAKIHVATIESVRKELEATGWKPNRRTTKEDEERVQSIIESYLQGDTANETMPKVGVTRAQYNYAVHGILKKMRTRLAILNK